jgi:chaperonin GroEL (HSP60 family)
LHSSETDALCLQLISVGGIDKEVAFELHRKGVMVFDGISIEYVRRIVQLSNAVVQYSIADLSHGMAMCFVDAATTTDACDCTECLGRVGGASASRMLGDTSYFVLVPPQHTLQCSHVWLQSVSTTRSIDLSLTVLQVTLLLYLHNSQEGFGIERRCVRAIESAVVLMQQAPNALPLVAGGGACEMALSRHLRQLAQQPDAQASESQCEALIDMAQSLEAVVECMIVNGALDVQATCTSLLDRLRLCIDG